MYRTTIQIIIIIAAFGLSGNATAFTLRPGPVTDAAASVRPAPADTDLPTPQFFQVAIGRNGMILGAVHPSEGYGAPQPQIRYQEVRAPQPVPKRESRQASHASAASRLKGAELLLLRQTQIVAEGQDR